MNRSYEYLAGKLLAVVITAILLFETTDTGILTIRMLVFGCLFALQQLLLLIKGGMYKKWGRLCQAAVLVWAFLMGMEQAFLIVIMAAMEFLDEAVQGALFYEIGGVLLLLLWFVYRPGNLLLLFTGVLLVSFLLIRYLEQRRELLWQANLEQKEKLEQLISKQNGMKEYARTLQETAAMEERNRFAARIHDQLGHTISGSIILLEATALSLAEKEGEPKDEKKEAAIRNLSLVTENLRKGVDEIRAALRQERPGREQLGIHEIRKALEEFKLTYGRKTILETEGELAKISTSLWICIQDNLKEALTNMLKHSEGDTFVLRIHCMNQVIRVEYADNGKCTDTIKPGMGLGAIEERTAACGGTVLFNGGQGGFRIVTLFV